MFETLIDDHAWTAPECPGPPAWRLDWPAVLQCYPWLAELAGVPQEPAHHGEGDVLTHTRLVVEALVAQAAWRTLSPAERSILFLAALLHDLGKAACTITEGGQIVSPGHSRVSMYRARALLAAGAGFEQVVPFACREAVARLARHHGLPLWFLDRPDPRRAVIEASLSARLDRVALLAEADAIGRSSVSQAQLLDRLALFREYCAEQGCLNQPRAFASNLTRVRYCRGQCDDPDRLIYDDTTAEVTLLAGLPATGKDTWLAQQSAGLSVISLDALRAELGVAAHEGQGPVVRLARARARALLRQRRSFIWNATNTSRSLRSALIDLFSSYHARVRIVYLDAALPTVLLRNQSRRAPVPASVIHRLLSRLDVPDLTEAQHVEWRSS